MTFVKHTRDLQNLVSAQGLGQSANQMSQGQHSLPPPHGSYACPQTLMGLLWGSQELAIWKRFHCQMPLSPWANILGKDDPLTSINESLWASSGLFPTRNCFVFQHPEYQGSCTSHPSSLRERTQTTTDFSLSQTKTLNCLPIIKFQSHVSVPWAINVSSGWTGQPPH